MPSGDTPWPDGASVMIRSGKLCVEGVDKGCKKAFEKARADIEAGRKGYHISIGDGVASWSITDVSTPIPTPRPAGNVGKVRKVRNLARAVARHAANGFKPATAEEYDRRMAICRACPYWREKGNAGLGECTVCGCTRSKQQWQSETCPKGNW